MFLAYGRGDGRNRFIIIYELIIYYCKIIFYYYPLLVVLFLLIKCRPPATFFAPLIRVKLNNNAKILRAWTPRSPLRKRCRLACKKLFLQVFARL